jgi:hypothetical protein
MRLSDIIYAVCVCLWFSIFMHYEITKQGCFCVFKEKNNESTEDYSVFLANIVIPRSNIDVSIHSISMYFHTQYFLFICWCSNLYMYNRLIFVYVIYICIYNSFTSYPQISTTLLQLRLWKDRFWTATVWCPTHFTSYSMTLQYRIWTTKYLLSRLSSKLIWWDLRKISNTLIDKLICFGGSRWNFKCFLFLVNWKQTNFIAIS